MTTSIFRDAYRWGARDTFFRGLRPKSDE